LAKIAAHATAGGTLTVLQGGKFGHGFVSAGFTEALSPAVGQLGEGRDFGTVLAKTAVSAAIGGTASKLSGGSFANGAATGAFQQLFNHVVSAAREAYEQAKAQAHADAKALASPHYALDEYGELGDNFHFYEIGPTALCSENTTWCTFDKLSQAIDTNAVPFNISDSGEGNYNLPFGTGTDPIRHFRPDRGVWVNATSKGHRYHRGRVIHVLVKVDRTYWMHTVGIGNGPNPQGNINDGMWIFSNTHNAVRASVLINGGR